MKAKIFRNALLVCVLVLTTSMPGHVRADEAQKTTQPSIYDEFADGSKQIADALPRAQKEGKHILLQFGANWCGWCHKLHRLFDTDQSIAEELESHYVVVMIDVNKEHNKEVDLKYGHPTRFGLPVIVILDSNGRQLTTQDTGKLEEGDHHNPDKVLAFLKEWAHKELAGQSPVIDQVTQATDFVGKWTNKDFQTRDITRVYIRQDGDTAIVHEWGRCHPKECDWGEATVTQKGSALSVAWQPGFAVEIQELTLLADGSLQVTMHTHFTDNSGRKDYDTKDIFAKGVVHDWSDPTPK